MWPMGDSRIIRLWADAFRQRNFKFKLFVVFALASASVYMTVNWLVYNETRTSAPLNDVFLALFNPIDLNVPICIVTNLAIFIGIGSSIVYPYNMLRTLLGIIIIALLRVVTMYFFPLEAPELIIPLRDPFLETTFYDGQVLMKDLFFSGHTANIFVLCLLTPFKKIKIFLGVATLAIGTMLLLQHVHYTIDVVAAPFFSLAAFYLADRITKNNFKYSEKSLA